MIPLSRSSHRSPILKNPANRHRAVGLTPEQWHYVFANTFSEEESLALYERYHIPASGRIFWGSALANIHPGKDDTYVDYHNDARPPLLFISGKKDHSLPAQGRPLERQALQVEHGDRDRGVRRAASPARGPGVEEVADFALDWALKHATSARSRVMAGIVSRQ